MLRAIKSLFGVETKATKRKNRRPAARRRLGMEGLETRNLMAGLMVVPSQPMEPVVPSAVTVNIENHDLVIRGTDGPDKVQVSPPVNGKYVVKITTEINGKAQTQTSYWRFTGGDVFFYGNKGDDHFMAMNNLAERVTAYGGPGNDYLLGSNGNDNLNGGDGQDEVRGGRGNDTLNGDAGDDKIYGYDGNDHINGGAGYDQILGELGDDTIQAGYDFAPNYVEGGYGNDTITGGYGIDELHGNAGNDAISGNVGDDIITGDDGTDYLYGNAGYDNLNGGAGNDYLYGDQGNDYLYGGNGNDHLYGGDGDDDLDGGNYQETDYLYGQGGKDRSRSETNYNGSGYNPPAGPGGLNAIQDLEPGEEIYYI